MSLTASPNHDGSLICSQAAVTSSGIERHKLYRWFRDSDGNLSPVGGTSAGSPAFAGIVAILNQATQSGGLGNVNPTLYSLGGTGAFHDITTGNNIVPCTSGTPAGGSASLRCPTSAPFQIGYSAAAGYDLVTGLGSVNANVLATSWPGFDLDPGLFHGGHSGKHRITGTGRDFNRDPDSNQRLCRHGGPRLCPDASLNYCRSHLQHSRVGFAERIE